MPETLTIGKSTVGLSTALKITVPLELAQHLSGRVAVQVIGLLGEGIRIRIVESKTARSSFGKGPKNDPAGMSVLSVARPKLLFKGIKSDVVFRSVAPESVYLEDGALVFDLPRERQAPVPKVRGGAKIAEVPTTAGPTRDDFAAAVRTVNAYKARLGDVLELRVAVDGTLRGEVMEVFQ